MTTEATIKSFYHALYDAYGPQGWWPGDGVVEIVVGAILTQNTAWTNVQRAIANLRKAKLLTWDALRDISDDDLAAAIRPSGTYRVKAKRIRAFVDWLFREFDGDTDAMFARPLPALRDDLLNVHGIGPETADAILLYAGGLPTFVVDAYTRRVLRRHGLIGATADYATVKTMFESQLPADVALFNEYHALLVHVGKRHCRATATCEGCPLAGFPHDGGL